MKHSDSERQINAIIEAGRAVDVVMTSEEASTLHRHLALVLEANERLNLTRISDFDEAIRLHIIDSAVAIQEVSEAPPGAIADVGTGAGYPGIPLAVLSGRKAVLLDSVRKKAVAVEEMVNALGLSNQISVVAERAEEHALAHRGGYALVVARAVSALPSLVELASPLLVAGGLLVALKGALSEEEVERGRAAGQISGMAEKAYRRVYLPGGGETRTVVVFEKSKAPKIPLPRRTGLAQKSPLA